MLLPDKTDGDTEWFTNDRFGLFIHWGLYALPARHEWVRHNERISNDEYQKYFNHFDPDLYDPCLWAEAASNAGMKYFVVTTKHHEGFSLWDTKLSEYKATNTPYGKDLLRPMVDAFRAKGLKVGFYYSLLDWYHPEYTIDHIHPLRDELAAREQSKERDLSKYVDFLHGQTRELLTQFGKVDILWYDFSISANEWHEGKGKNEWRGEDLIKLIRSLQPKIILNDRLEIDQDVKTPEQFQPREWVQIDGKPVVWEACQTLSGSWGYHRDEESWKSVDMLLQMLIDSVSKGGNMLLNVGPTGRGEFDYRALERLQGIGEWMKRHQRSIYGCTQAPEEYIAPPDTRFTFNPKTKRLYLHLFSWPYRHVHLEGAAAKIEYAQLLNDASEIKLLFKIPEAEYGAMKEVRNSTLLTLEIPVKKPNSAVPVIELFLK